MTKKELIEILKEKSLDILKIYGSKNIRIEINCNADTNQAKVSIQEINI